MEPLQQKQQRKMTFKPTHKINDPPVISYGRQRSFTLTSKTTLPQKGNIIFQNISWKIVLKKSKFLHPCNPLMSTADH